MQFLAAAEKNGKQTAESAAAANQIFNFIFHWWESLSSGLSKSFGLLSFSQCKKSATNLQALVQQTFIDLSNPAAPASLERKKAAFNPDLIAFKGQKQQQSFYINWGIM